MLCIASRAARARLKLRQVLAALVITSLALAACSDTDDSGNGGDCGPSERLVDGRCEPIGGRDLGSYDLGADAGVDLDVDLPETCTPGDRYCPDTQTAAVCDDGGVYVAQTCGGDQICSNGSCVDSGLICSPGANIGCNDPTSYRQCDDAGTGYDVVPCPNGEPNCLGSGVCSSGVCLTGDLRCVFEPVEGVQRCNDDGSGWDLVEECGAGLSCDGGTCLSPCEENSKVTSFLGCDYWAADLDNIDDAAAQQFSVSVSNPNEEPVNVTIQSSATGTSTTATVGAETVQAINIDRLDVNGTGRTRNAYHITTDLPVTMHQFNPANNVGVFSNDASLLLPTNAAGQRYVVLGWPTGPFGTIGNNAHAYATVIAVSDDGPTDVQVTPSVDVTAGGGINAMQADTLTEVRLEPGEVLNLQTRSEDDRDLSGTIVEASAPVQVFAGHECAFVPDETPTPYCDHVEQQLYPVEAWGTRYFGAKLSPRGTEIDVWRVVAAEPDTVLTTVPAVSGVNGLTLQPGTVLEFETNQSFELTATAPVLLGQFMTGSNYPGIPSTCWQPITSLGGGTIPCSTNSQCLGLISGATRCDGGICEGGTGVGDPAFMLSVPVQQYRDNYIFLTPADYRDDFFTVIAPIGTELTLDGNPLLASSLTPIGDTGFGFYYHDVSSISAGSDPAQAHTITGSNAFALQVYGYDCDVSYAYPGGLNLEAEEE